MLIDSCHAKRKRCCKTVVVQMSRDNFVETKDMFAKQLFCKCCKTDFVQNSVVCNVDASYAVVALSNFKCSFSVIKITVRRDIFPFWVFPKKLYYFL